MNFNPLNAGLNPIYHLLALLGGATIVVVSRLRVNVNFNFNVINSASVGEIKRDFNKVLRYLQLFTV